MLGISKYHIDSGLAVLFLIVLSAHFSWLAPGIDRSLLVGTAIVGLIPVMWGAWSSLREKEWASMDLLASIALIFSLLSHEWVSAVFIELMLAAARILDDVTRDSTEKSIRGLLKLRPDLASVERKGALVRVRLSEVRVGDRVVVGLGDRIPVDGVVLSGTAAVDESTLTGESLPVEKTTGSRVMSSTLVQSGSLRMKTTHTGKDTTLERVIHLVESAREEKPSSQTLGEKFGRLYLTSIFIAAIALYVFTWNLSLVLAVVLVVCADDIAVAIPIAYLRAIRAAARIGVIVKGGKHLEALGKIETIVFDKTGTLTTGKLQISNIVAVRGLTEEDVVEAGALAAVRSTHPFARALAAYAKHHRISKIFPDSIEERGGKGIAATLSGEMILLGKREFLKEMKIVPTPELIKAADREAALGRSISYVARDGHCLGFVSASDRPKEEAKKALSALRELGIKRIVMLTGDNRRAAKAIAEELGVDEWHADLRPEEKVEIVRKLQARSPVAMVGDGVNDAAALSIAGVGIAMGGLGAEGTIESAQIVLMRDDLATLPEAIRIAHMARIVSLQDFLIWGATNSVGLALVFGGFIGPAGAAAYNFLSDFLPLLNSIRVRARI